MVETVNIKFRDVPLALRWRYVRMVMVANCAGGLCRILFLPVMTEYKLIDGSSWNRKL